MCGWFLLFVGSRSHGTPAVKLAIPSIMSLLLVSIWIGTQSLAPLFDVGWFDQHATLVQLLKTVVYLGIFLLALLLIRSKRRLEILAWTILIGGTVQALIAIMANQTGTFINYNHLAGYLEMSLAIGIGLLISHLNPNASVSWRETARRWIKTLLGPKARVRIMLVIMVIGLIVSRSRMGNTAFFASMMIAGVICLLMFRRYNWSVVILFASLVVIDFFLMGAFFGIDKLQQRFEQLDIQGDERALVRNSSESLIREHPIFGVGAGTYYAALPQFRSEKNTQLYLHAHNDFMEFQSELGLIGTVPLLLVVLWSLFMAVRVQQKRHSALMKSMGFSATMAISAIMIHSTSDFNLHIIANAGTFMVVLALPFIAMTVDRHNLTHNH